MHTGRLFYLYLGFGCVWMLGAFRGDRAAAQDKPMGAPLILSTIETEQEVPLPTMSTDGKSASCVSIKLHWISQRNIGPNDDAASFTLDLPDNNPGAPIFMAQLWNASLASALAWQEPWEGARWKILQTPVCDGTGIDAALAVGMIATSARRPYPPKTVVIGHLNPDGSLGPVSHLVDRINAAANAGMTRVVIPSVQRFDTDASGQVVNIVRVATDLHMDCVPADDLVGATESTMNDPLPDSTLDASLPKYTNDVASYIDDFARKAQGEAANGLRFAPKELALSTYPARQAIIWKSIFADYNAGQEAYRAGRVYVAYRLFTEASGKMGGVNALASQNRTLFDVKAALAEAEDLHDHVHILMNPPIIDQGGLESAVLVAEMADWAFEIQAALEGAELVTKQTFSQRSDATQAEKDRAREAIVFANEQCKYLLTQSSFYTGLLPYLSKNNPVSVDENAAHLLPQLIPAQLATARSFTDGIRGSDLRERLLFDARLVAYVNVLKQVRTDWESHQRKREIQSAAGSPPPPSSSTNAPSANAGPTKLNSSGTTTAVGFDPGSTYEPPHTVVAVTQGTKKLSDAAQCLIWVDHECEIATLEEKYLRLGGSFDPATHEWHVKDHARLDALLQQAEIGARHGIAFARKAEIDQSVLAMIYEHAAHERTLGDDASALTALRNFWRCALLGNVCWQLAHTPKAQPVDLSAESAKDTKNKKNEKKTDQAISKSDESPKPDSSSSNAPAALGNGVVVVNPPGTITVTNTVVTPSIPPETTNAATSNPPDEREVHHQPTQLAVLPVTPEAPKAEVAATPPIAPASSPVPTPAPALPNEDAIPVAPIATNIMQDPTPPPVAPVVPIATAAPPKPSEVATPGGTVAPPPPTASEPNIPVAPIAKVEDFGGNSSASTNAPPRTVNPDKTDNADGHGSF